MVGRSGEIEGEETGGGMGSQASCISVVRYIHVVDMCRAM